MTSLNFKIGSIVFITDSSESNNTWEITDIGARGWITIKELKSSDIRKVRASQLDFRLVEPNGVVEESVQEEAPVMVDQWDFRPKKALEAHLAPLVNAQLSEAKEDASSVEGDTQEIDAEIVDAPAVAPKAPVTITRPTPNQEELALIKATFTISKELKKAIKAGTASYPTRHSITQNAQDFMDQHGLSDYVNKEAFERLTILTGENDGTGLFIMRVQNLLVGASSRKNKDLAH